MAMFGNELMKAEENEEDVNEFNDETFGASTAFDEDWEWEKDHEKMAEVLKGSVAMETQLQPSLEYYNDDGELDLDENDLKNKLSQLIVDDDDEEEEEQGENFIKRNSKAKRAIDLEELFGPSSPPGLFPADELISGIPNIWGSPIRDSFMKDHSGGLKSLLQSLQKNPSFEEPSRSTALQGSQSFGPPHPVVLPGNVKTVEEIEQELLQGGERKTCWRLEDVERALTGDGAEGDPKAAAPLSLVSPDSSAKHVGSGREMPNVDLPPGVTHPLVRMPMINQGIPVVPGVAPMSWPSFPVHGFGRGGPLPLAMLSPLPGQRPPGIDVRHWNQGSNSIVPMLPPHLSMNNFNYILASRAAMAGFALGPNRQMLQRLPGFPHPGMPPLPIRNQAQPNRPMSLKERTSHQTINPHHLLQHQQHFQQQQMHYQQHGYYGNPGRRQAGIVGREESAVDEYAGLMQQREKDWIIKIQLLQLQTDNPYVDDYYYTCWSIKKMLKEKQKKEGIVEKDRSSGEPVLVLPQLAKVETKAYTPVQFEGSLGKLTASSIHNPRQIIDFHVPISTDHEDGLHMERKRFKEILLEIEKCYDILLNIDDSEKKALAQPLQERSVLHEQRCSLIKSLYQRICIPPVSSDGSAPNRPGLSGLISIHKGLLLAIRLLPLLERSDSVAFSCLLLQKLPQIMKKDWQQEDWPRLYNAIACVIRTASLDNLIRFASEINKESNSKNQLNSILSVVQNKLGVSLVLALVSRAEIVYSTQSPLDLGTDEQQKWRSFVELLASALENLAKDMLVRPIETLKNVSDHFVRFLDKRQMLAIEDKLDIILSGDV